MVVKSLVLYVIVPTVKEFVKFLCTFRVEDGFSLPIPGSPDSINDILSLLSVNNLSAFNSPL
jgi:hypothetical protein